MNLKEGDVFITKLERNFFGAFKILRIGKPKGWEDQECLLVGILDFIDKEKPKVTNERFNKILFANRFSSENKPCINLFVADPIHNNIGNFEYLGNSSLTKKEIAFPFALGDGEGWLTDGIIEGFPMAGKLENNFGSEMFYEWKWRNEKDIFIKEVENTKVIHQRIMTPKTMMKDNLFWKIIGLINWKKEDDDERMIAPIEFLSKKSDSEIKQFKENLSYKLYQLDTKEHAKNIGEESFKNEETHFSADYFLYVRCCVIANGKDFFENSLNNPKQMPKDLDFEPLLYLAEEAYEKRMNKELNYQAGCDYETFSNIKGWE